MSARWSTLSLFVAVVALVAGAASVAIANEPAPVLHFAYANGSAEIDFRTASLEFDLSGATVTAGRLVSPGRTVSFTGTLTGTWQSTQRMQWDGRIDGTWTGVDYDLAKNQVSSGPIVLMMTNSGGVRVVTTRGGYGYLFPSEGLTITTLAPVEQPVLPPRPPDEPPAWVCKFASVSRDVEVVRAGDPTNRDFAKLNMVLYPGDHVVTGANSSAILAFADLKTYVVGAESEIIIPELPKPTSKLGLVSGRIWTNIIKMLNGEALEIRSYQAVTSIRGTTLVIEATPVATTVKVIEGKVSVRPIGGGPETIVTGGRAVVASSTGVGPVIEFDANAETAVWQAMLGNLASAAFAWPNGDRYVGSWSGGKMSGQGVYTFAGGNRYTGQFADGKFHGTGTFVAQGGAIVQPGTWRNGAFVGSGLEESVRTGAMQVSGRMSPDGTIQGTWTDDLQGGRRGTFVARRAGGVR
jgi:hypothetical protein